MSSEQIVCEVCGILVDANKYQRHLKFGHKEKTNNSNKINTKNYDNKKDYICTTCQKGFTSLYNLKYHVAQHINARNFLCTECPRAYNTAADLSQHQKIHEKPRDTFKCDECGEIFEFKSKYKKHLRIHKVVPIKGPKECPICKKVFVSLSKHNRTVHMNLRNYPCKLCEKKFGKKSGLDRHVQTVHEKQRNFICEICNKAFGEKSQLKKHSEIHLLAQDANYCKKCKESFEDIQEHYDEFHPNFKHSCPTCSKRFEKPSKLEMHIKTVHSTYRSYFCDYCCKGFVEKYQLMRHLKLHENNLNTKNDEDSVCTKVERIFIDPLSTVQVEMKEEMKSEISEKLSDIDLLHDNVKVKEEIQSDNEMDINEYESYDELIKCEVKDNDSIDSSQEELFIESKNSDEKVVDSYSLDQLMTDQHLSNKNSKNLVVCIGCGNSFGSKTTMQSHFKKYHDRAKGFHCAICNAMFAKLEHLKIHYQSNHADLKFDSKDCTHKCEECDRIFKNERTLKTHIDAMHKKIVHECEICKKTFGFRTCMDRHIQLVHHQLKPHECEICKMRFGTKIILSNHYDRYHNENPIEHNSYNCEDCDKEFSSLSSLDRHKKGVHENVKIKGKGTFRCKYCHEWCLNKYKKEKHMTQVHLNGERLKRICGHCKMEFDFYDDYIEHIESHEGIFICIICGESFLNAKNLKHHSESHKRIGLEMRKYECDSCGHRLFNKIQLKVHMRKHVKDGNFYVCDICGKSYKFFAPFYYHKKLHAGQKDFVCTYCDKGFVQKQELITHIRVHTHEKPFECTVCSKRFAYKQILNTHLQTHSSTRVSYGCTECKESFFDKSKLKQHEEAFHPEKRPFVCFICNMSFKHEHHFQAHKKHKHNLGDDSLSNENDISNYSNL